MGKLTENFDSIEFRSKDAPGTPIPYNYYENVYKTAQNLQILRDHLSQKRGMAAPITVTSGWRTQEHNAKVGGAKHSQHLTGKAADIVVSGFTPEQVADEIEYLIAEGKMTQGGIGRYDTFTHYDHRGVKVRWVEPNEKKNPIIPVGDQNWGFVVILLISAFVYGIYQRFVR